MNIIYEDKYFIAINKDAGIEVDDNLIKLIKKENLNIENLYLVHRIDKYTSGIVILAKDENIKKYFEDAFKNRNINKIYHAIVEGIVKNNKGTINLSIGKDEKNPNKRIILSVKSGGENAITNYEVLKKLKEHTLMKLNPITGRTHQIRVHLSSIGHPIIGDKIYSKNAKIYKMKSFALIAKEIHFIHPITKKNFDIIVEYNKEFFSRLKLLEI
ncbi:RluA family pseudouridine synthase [Brachyspira catarrhinii]|uniref:RluA family pseudouridine synthase n=1 Tax=Brachyspira catarrhinii TaxID=2528966 RepID=A0ABY2TQN4_9SPIR|nr:RluA family pseudouridine synthase [Brachyspira catarrhinii]